LPGGEKPELTQEQIREAERGLYRLLRSKRFPLLWIDGVLEDVMAQAQLEFVAGLAAGRIKRPVEKPVGLLVVIAYRRAIKLARAERRRPPTRSLESLFHVADEKARTPEQVVIDRESDERVTKALASLPAKERLMMRMIETEDCAVREAGRRLNWGKTSAHRHYHAALERLQPFLEHR
jgi:RNA polymerase sigma factor (sigma-70 family)